MEKEIIGIRGDNQKKPDKEKDKNVEDNFSNPSETGYIKDQDQDRDQKED